MQERVFCKLVIDKIHIIEKSEDESLKTDEFVALKQLFATLDMTDYSTDAINNLMAFSSILSSRKNYQELVEELKDPGSSMVVGSIEILSSSLMKVVPGVSAEGRYNFAHKA